MKLETSTIRRLRDALLRSGRRPSIVLSPAYETLARKNLLSPEERTALTRIEPVAETMYLMMAADGRVQDAERDAIRGAIRGLTGDLLQDAGVIAVMLETFEARLRESGRDARLQEIAAEIGSETSKAEAAFVLAAAVALADDNVTDEETAFIRQLAVWFRIPTGRATRLLDELEQDAPRSA